MRIDEAYIRCEQITWEQARNFAYGIRLLPPAKRRALAAVYAFARRIDDIGDGDLPVKDKVAQLEQARSQVSALIAAVGGASGSGSQAGFDDSDPVLVALRHAGTVFPIPLAAFNELIDGCLADVTERSYKTFDDLLWYCRCVAGSIGRLSLGIYQGERETVPRQARSAHRAAGLERQARLADDLGVALQLTNILRDVREDFLNNRIYLPEEDLNRFGIEFAPFGEPGPLRTEQQRARFASLVEFEAARAREWYDSGLRLLATIDRRSAACTGAMAGIYRRLLDRIDRNPGATLQARMSLPGSEKALVAVQALAGVDRWRYRTGARR